MNVKTRRSLSRECSGKRERLLSGELPQTEVLPDYDDDDDDDDARQNNNNTVVANHNNDYWPDVFDEARAMLLSAILIYGVVDLRGLARKYKDDKALFASKQQQQQQQQQLEDEDEDDNYNYTHNHQIDDFLVGKLLSLPIAAKDIVREVGKHRQAIQEEIGSESTDLYLDAFDAIQSTSSSRELELEFNAVSGKVSLVSFDVVVVEDEFAGTELVYGICVDTAQRRITVLFRGCSTRKDWKICANNFLKEHHNPLFTEDDDDDDGGGGQPENIGIHSGYCNYLFSTDTHDGVSKFEAIMTHLRRLLRDYPGYHVYVTGHSLGAALATVFAFQAAATQQFGGSATTVLTCINFASPMVGNLAFETAFRELESRGRLRCLRVTNHFDIFTQLPDRGNWLYFLFCCWGISLVAYVGWSLLFYVCWQSNVYRHVGMNLHMYNRSGDYKLKHPTGSSNYFAWRVVQDWKKHFKQTIQRLMMVPFVFRFDTNHSAQEHLKRLANLSSELGGVYLEDWYATKRFPSPRATRKEADLV
jgi:hypothetical protein